MQLGKFNSHLNRQQGVTLIELMVGLVVALIAAVFITKIYVDNIRSTKEITSASRLENDMRSAMTLMVDEIRRAGYWGATISAGAINDPENNLFSSASTGTNLLIGAKTGEAANTCITFSYDRNEDGTADDGEHRGFRLNDGKIDIRTSTSLSNANDCDAGTWQAITDDNVVSISSLSYSEVGSQCLNTDDLCDVLDGSGNPTGEQTLCLFNGPCSSYTAPSSGDKLIEKRLITITMRGELVNDNTVKKVLSESVHVRNNRVFLAP